MPRTRRFTLVTNVLGPFLIAATLSGVLTYSRLARAWYSSQVRPTSACNITYATNSYWRKDGTIFSSYEDQTKSINCSFESIYSIRDLQTINYLEVDVTGGIMATACAGSYLDDSQDCGTEWNAGAYTFGNATGTISLDVSAWTRISDTGYYPYVSIKPGLGMALRGFYFQTN
jgi:hypothetical protein